MSVENADKFRQIYRNPRRPIKSGEVSWADFREAASWRESSPSLRAETIDGPTHSCDSILLGLSLW
jgi:hypothetical protein